MATTFNLTPEPARHSAEPTAELRLEVQGRLRDDIWALVYCQMRALTGRSLDLDDLAQAAAERALRALPQFAGRAELSTWTYRICYRTMLDERRWYRRWARRFSLTLDGAIPETSDFRMCAAEVLERRERAARVREALERVPPKRRAVVLLHDLEGKSLAEVAEIVDTNLLTVRSRLRDGRRALLRELAADPYFGDEPSGEEAT